MNSIYLCQIDKNVTKEGIRAYENNASALDGMSAMISRTLIDIAESLFGEYEQKCEECERLKRENDKLLSK